MVASAGETIVVPYEVCTVDTSSSAAFTAEAVVDTLTASLVTGETYEIEHRACWQSSVANDSMRARIREDSSTAGTAMTSSYFAQGGYGNVPGQHSMYARYTATATATKSFCVTGYRHVGSGSCVRFASSTCPSYFVIRRV